MVHLNEIHIGAGLSTSAWYGLYIAFNGTRLSGTDATAANLADCFEIRYINLVTGSVGSNVSTFANWGAVNSTTGGQVWTDNYGGQMTIAGRGANRNFHGKVARMVVSTLKVGVAMPDATEISMMVTDPVNWVQTYKVGQTYRLPANTYNSSVNFAIGGSGGNGTQVWQMGDGTLDAYPTIRSYTNENASTSGQAIRMVMQGQVSNDIENVTINGLS